MENTESKQWYAQNFDCSETFSQLIPDLEGTETKVGNLSRQMSVSMDAVEAFCKEHGIFKSTFFTGVYSYLLAKYNNDQEVLFGIVDRDDANGQQPEAFPIYAKFANDTKVHDFLKSIEELTRGCREHRSYSIMDVLSDLRLQIGSYFAWNGKAKDFAELDVPLYVMVSAKDGNCLVEAAYHANQYSQQLISQFLESYEAVVEGFLKGGKLCDINIATKAQVELLDSFNQNDVPYDNTQTIVSLFRQQAKATPDNIAVVFKEKKYTYKEVDEISDRIAGYIGSRFKVQGSSEEPVVSVLIPRSEWMAIASMGVLKAGCAYQPLDPSYPQERLNFMMQDADAKLLIADEELRGIVNEYQGEVLLTKDIPGLPALTEEEVSQLSTLNSQLKPDRLFIMLYTSGSTGVPKGCQLTHGNLVCFCHWYQRYYGLKPEHNVAAYASYGFDACMMDMYPALTCGASVYIIPEELRLDLVSLNDYFEQNNITHSFMTTQVGYQFATSIENHSLKHLSVGGEKLATLTPPTNYRFHNGYGPTECTIFTTTYPVDRKQKEIPIGKPVDNLHLYIVDPQGRRVPVGAAGELWISGPQVGRGYLNRPEKNAEVFIDNPFAGESGDTQKYARVYRTGDIVRYLTDGNIQFVGRKDGQVKIRGFRIELKEVEAVIREFPGIKDATVQAFDEDGGGKFIAAYIVSDEQVDIDALNNFILDQKPPYMVPAVTMQIDAIPLNQNQKVNKKALPKPEKKAADMEVESNVPMNVLEKEIHGIIAQIINTEEFGVTTVLGYVGLTSIMAIKLAIQINKRFGVTLDSKALAKTGSVQSIENDILQALLSGGAAKQQAGEVEHADMSNIPLSYAQMGVYVDCVKQPESTIYNTPVIAKFPKDVDIDLLIKSVQTLVKTHPMLQAHFGSAGADIIQIVDADQPVEITQSKHTEQEMPNYKWEFIRPFNLRQGPLYRIEIVTTEEHVYLIMDIHHLVVDGGSFDVLLAQLFELLNGQEIEPETFTYADFVAAQKAAESSKEYAAASDFFQTRLSKIEGVTEIPADLTNPKEQGTVSTLYTSLNFDEIDSFCRQHNISPAHHILAATFYALSRFANNDQLCITTISNGRSDLRISNTVGMFVNTLALSAFIEEQSVMEFLNETSKNFDETLRHESYPFARIASDYDLTAEIMFAYQMGIFADYQYNGQSVAIDTFETDTPKFRIAFFIQNDPEGKPSICLQYDNGRYSKELMQSLAQSISNAANAFISNPDAKLKSVSLLDDKQTTLLDSFNQTDVPYDNTQTVVSLFRKQVESVPDNIAVIYHDVRLTYKQVDEMSDRIAGYICSKLQVQGSRFKVSDEEPVVSILIPRSEWMVIASLGVLKAGCAYQPLDPSYPKERLNFMMQDASAKLLIANEELRDIVDEYQGEVLLTKDIEKLPALTEEQNSQLSTLNSQLKPDRLFILLYTSGSTGVPKGCQLEHGNLVCFCHWYQRFYDLKPGDKVAAYASYGFDACMMDMYPALTTGATVVIVGEDIRLNLPDLNAYFNEVGVTHSFMTTQVGCQFAMNCDNHSLHHLSVGGEKILPLTPPKNYKFHNAYGPTECTIFTTTYQQTEFEQNAPIGKPLDNLQLFIVDKDMNRLPLGAAGEMLVAGPQVSRGYLNLPEKTAETYVQWNGKRCYRTGDVVRYLADGNIQFVGRRDGQVKIRGFRIELKEVESVIREFPGIKDATVQAFDEEGGGKFIAAYIVGDQEIDIEALNNFILDQKPPYMVPAVTMQIEAIPLNQNQKVNKKALPKPEKKAAGLESESNVPMNELEQKIHSIIAEIINTEDFGITTILRYAGLTSIMAIKLAIQINKRFGVALDSKSLAKMGSVKSIENEILKAPMSGNATKQETAEVKHADMSNIPLSYAQMGVYVDCMKQPTATVYNIPAAIRFPKGTDVQLFSKSVETIIRVHSQFHVHFDSQGGDIIQILDTTQPVVIEQSELSDADIEKYMADFVKPFNLRQGPLYRMEIVTTEENVYLLADVHHLIYDGASFDLFLDQLCDLMNGKKIESESFTYADFVAAQKDAENSKEYAEARDFFQERLGKIESVTEVPADLTNPKEQGTVSTLYTPLNFDEIDKFSRQHNISPSHHILAATFYVLSRFTNNDQLCITTISNGRSDLRISNTVGMFVNTLALSAFIEEQSVMEFINETSMNFDETLRHESYPFARIASDYDLSAEIMFAYQIGVLEGHEYKGQPVTMELFESDTPKFRIAFYIQNDPEGKPSICLQYDNGRYSKELMQSLAQSISNAANAFISNPDAKLKSVSLLDDKQTTLLDSFNQTDVPYDNTQTVVSLFRKQVESVPDNIAVIYHDVRLTYKQVDEMSDRIAGYICSKLQVQGSRFKVSDEEPVVSILIPRSEWMVIASLGVLKAGCAYQPLDPSYPKERLNFMMQDASAKLLIADEELRDIVDEYQGEVLLTKDIEKLPALTEEQNSQLSTLNSQLKPDRLFILLYTSGSTGVPKGCQLEHGNLVCFCHWYQRFYDLKPGDKVAAYASYGFDACMMDMYPALTTGATVVIVGEDIRLNLPDLNAYFNEVGVTHSFMTTQVGCQFAMNCDNHSLHHLSVGGEKILPLTPPKNYKFHNAYGPTECTIFTTTYQQTEFEQNAPIGKPLDNLQLFIVDKDMNRLPLGAAGEMLVAGPQVSRGYLNLPEKTAETYVQWNGKRCYRTGDVVRYLADGNIQFVGRRDGQVKIRGFRIELKEVESVIREFPGIKDATVQAFDYENGGKFIAAYIVSDEQIDIKELNDFIGKQKPSYMIPAATMQIDSIPLNQNQKVNKKALPAPVVQAVDHKYVEPANDTEKLFCSIFGEVLSMDKIGATDNFFELGGTSLMVTKVIIEADKAGHHVAYGDVFTHATPRLLAQFVTGETPVENTDDEVTNFDYTGIDAILQQNNVGTFVKGERQELDNVLLTGATGYLGIHVLRELIDSDAPTITCLVRAQDQPAAERRLKNLLFYYFETSFKELFGTRLFVINGDVTQDLISLTSNFSPLNSQIDTVFNCAANVKHFSKTSDIEDVNIGGAQRCVEFCLQTGAKLVHISTTSVAEMLVIRNDGEEVPKLDERKFWFGQFLDNRYIHSKFLAERIVLDAVARHGLNGKVMRVGNLAPRSYDGEFQVNFNSNSYMGRLKVFSILGCCPYDSYDESVEMSPIDQTAKAVVLLATTPKGCTVFQPFNNHTELLGDVLQLLSKMEKKIDFVENEEFEKALTEAGQDQEKAKLLSAMLAYQDMAHGQKAVLIERDNRYTCAILHRLGFHWSDTAWDYIERMLIAISGFGYFEE